MAKDITIHKSFSLIEKFGKNDSLTVNERMLLKYLPHKVQNIIWELLSSMMFPIPYCFSAIMTAVSGSIRITDSPEVVTLHDARTKKKVRWKKVR